MCMIFINLYYLNGKCSSRVSCFCVIKPLLYVTFNDIILLETRISESQPSRQKHTYVDSVRFVNTGLRRIST